MQVPVHTLAAPLPRKLPANALEEQRTATSLGACTPVGQSCGVAGSAWPGSGTAIWRSEQWMEELCLVLSLPVSPPFSLPLLSQ